MAVTRETTLLLLSVAGKRAAATDEEGPSRRAVPAAATKKRKLGTATEGLVVSDRFAVDLMRTCVAPGEGCLRPSSENLRRECWRLQGVAGLGMF